MYVITLIIFLYIYYDNILQETTDTTVNMCTPHNSYVCYIYMYTKFTQFAKDFYLNNIVHIHLNTV